MTSTLKEVDNTDELSIPDMRDVLANFNIYVKSHDDDDAHIDAQVEDSQTISQRIKTLSRESKCRPPYLSTH